MLHLNLHKRFCLVASLLMLLGCYSSAIGKTDMPVGGVLLPDGQTRLTIEIAETRQQRERGLMDRRVLADNHGMLFVFPEPAMQYMWMKNTLLKLDVLFLSEDARIIKVLSGVVPCVADPCAIYDSALPAAFMLEVNAGYADKHQLMPGQKLLFDLPPDRH